MIDKITITVDENGVWLINAGDVLFHRTTVVYEALLEVKGYLNKLAYFPTGTHLDIAPTPFDELPNQVSVRKHKESEKERKARIKAEKHLDELRQDKAPESPREPLPTPQTEQPGVTASAGPSTHQVEPLARIRTGEPPTTQPEQGSRTATGAPGIFQLSIF